MLYLDKIYAACTCLIAASEDEGFGLPLIEAAQHKLPILARDIPVFREVAGKYASYFYGNDPQDLVNAIRGWLMLYQNDRHPKSEAMSWVTWSQSTQRLLNVLMGRREALGGAATLGKKQLRRSNQST